MRALHILNTAHVETRGAHDGLNGLSIHTILNAHSMRSVNAFL